MAERQRGRKGVDCFKRANINESDEESDKLLQVTHLKPRLTKKLPRLFFITLLPSHARSRLSTKVLCFDSALNLLACHNLLGASTYSLVPASKTSRHPSALASSGTFPHPSEGLIARSNVLAILEEFCYAPSQLRTSVTALHILFSQPHSG